MRVRIHLNLAAPDRAESAVKIQSPKGGWVTVAYAQEITLDQVEPVVDHKLRERVRRGEIKKVPHAFIEGELVSFRGRWRSKAPPALRMQAEPHRLASARSSGLEPAPSDRTVGYNPRVASCFYATVPDRDPAKISEAFVRADRLRAVGWSFYAQGGTFTPLPAAARCHPEDLARTSAFEKEAMGRGWATTQRLMASSPAPEPARRRRPRAA